MKSFEVCIRIGNEDYIDSLITSIARQDYVVYYNDMVDKVCFTVVEEDDVTELRT